MIAFFLSYLLVYKYAILFFVVAVTSVGVPLPATALIVAAGAFAAQWYLDIFLIIASGFFASVFGDILGYSVSFRYGRDIFARIGLGRLLASEKFAAVEKLFARHSFSVIFSSRFLITHLGPTVNILSGLSRIPPKRFLIYDIVGECIYATLFSGLGYAFGSQWKLVSSILGDVSAILVSIIVLAVLSAVVIMGKKRRRRR